MILATQLRAARSLLGWTANELANRSKVGVSTIRRYELSDGVVEGHVHTVSALKACLEQAGIEFIGPENGEIGVKLVMGDDKS